LRSRSPQLSFVSLGVNIVRIHAMVLLVALAPLARGVDAPFTPEELSEFLGPVSPDLVQWSRVGGVDFVVYHGVAQPPLSGRVGFYLGGWPSFEPEPGSTIVKGRLGIFPLKWYRKVTGDGTITQSALVKLDYYWKAHVWITAARQSDVDRLAAMLSQLPTFTKKPEPIPGMPQTALEYYWRLVIAIAVFLGFLTVAILTGWLLHRRWRRAETGLARRLFFLSAYVGCAMVVVAGIALGSAWVLTSVFSRLDSAQGIFIGSACVLLLAAICLIVFLFAGILVRVRARAPSA
jgi:hypothetical protein